MFATIFVSIIVFTFLTLGWSDGYIFVPLAFNLLSSAEKSKLYNYISTGRNKAAIVLDSAKKGSAYAAAPNIPLFIADFLLSAIRLQ